MAYVVQDAGRLDLDDPLAKFRERFAAGDPDLIYLDGNSLGPMPLGALEVAKRELESCWGDRLVRSWNEGWYELPTRIGDKIAKLVGARPGEVVCCDSTSVNLFKLVMAALDAKPKHSVIVSDTTNFPSDLYVLQGCARLAKRSLKIVKLSNPVEPDPAEIEAALSPDVALVALSHAAFKSGALHDMARLTEAAHKVGALMLWDLSHSVGAVPVQLNAVDADLAVACTYKYVNGGSGAPAFLYVRRDLQNELVNPIWGWFGQRDAFEFGIEYVPTDGIRRFLAGSPPIVSMALAEAGIDLILEAGIERVREKSMRQTEFLVRLWQDHLKPLGLTLNSPRDPQMRGSHVSFGHPDAWRICRALIEKANVIPDFRQPDNIRLGLSPLYTTYKEIAEGVSRLKIVLQERVYEEFPIVRSPVT